MNTATMRARGSPKGHQARRGFMPHLIMALFALSWSFVGDIPGVGRFYAAELVSGVALLFIGPFRLFNRYPILKRIIIIYLVLGISLIISDFYNSTPLNYAIRGAANIVFAAVNLTFLVGVLDRDISTLITMLFTLFISKMLFGEAAYGDAFSDFDFSMSSVFINRNYFKVRYVPFLTPIFILIGCALWRVERRACAVFFLIVSVLYLYFDARSAGLIFAVSAVVATVRFNPSLRTILLAVAGLSSALYIGYVIYVTYALHNLVVGNMAMQVYRMSNPYNPFELLLIGRSEWTIFGYVVADSPLFGFGSWARDPDGKYFVQRLLLTDRGSEPVVFNGLIPVHSVLGAAWIWCGALGFASALYLARVLIPAIRLLPATRSPFLPAALVMTVGLIWDYFFSPFQAIRLSFPQAIAVLIVVTAPFFATARNSWVRPTLGSSHLQATGANQMPRKPNDHRRNDIV